MAKSAQKKAASPIQDNTLIDYKNVGLLNKYTSRYGKIVARQYKKGITLQQQKKLATAIKRSRFMALMPYIN